ncbi:MMPL family transporter [Solimonas flava]|uniref:MMPL family transporter n=1 Tax=Solimonas flava TaxID=415849 RepID=UPI0004168B37|nr:MMPL family transporter [Solimonas flava]
MSARARLILWVVLMSAAGLWLWWASGSRLQLETDITAMLPSTAPDAVTRQALDRVDSALGRRSLFLVGAADFGDAERAAQAFADTLRREAAYADVTLGVDTDPAALAAAYGPARHLLLADADRARLARGEAAALADAALRALYAPAGLGPGGLSRVEPFADDPFDLYGHYLQQLLPAGGKLTLRDGVLAIERDDGVDVLVTATLRDSPFRLAVQDAAMPALDAAMTAARAAAPGVQVIGSGVLRHAAANTERAKREISTIGSISLSGVLLVFVLCFRSLRPLLLVLLSLGAASVVSLAAVATVYGKVHIVAVVFESSLIGLAVDYSIHFFSDRFRDARPWTGMDGLRHVGVPITVGMATTLLAYCSFLVPPFPGLRQMALLSMTGLVASYLTVTLAYPALAGHPPPASKPVLALRDRLARLGRPRPALLALLIALGLALLISGGLRLRFIDDVRALQSSPPALLDEEREVRERLGGGLDTRFFIVEGTDAEALLQHEEALRARLDALVARGALSGYSAVSRLVPSQARQAENAALLARALYADGSALATLYATVGYPPQAFARAQAAFAAARDARVLPDALLASPAGQAYRPLWLGPTARGMASVVSLSGVQDAGALAGAGAGLADVHLVDRVADISTVLGHYRRLALLGLGGSLCVIGLVLVGRYGLAGAARHLIAPLGGGLLTLATLGALGIPANLFTVLALLLVLGLGVDYSVFLREGEASRPTTLLAITLAGLVTLLAFGLLAGSATPFIRSLGQAVLLGVAYTWLLAVLAAAPAQTGVPECAPTDGPNKQ